MTRLVPVAPLEIDTWLSNVRKQGRVVYRVRLIIQHQGRRVRVAPDWPASEQREKRMAQLARPAIHGDRARSSLTEGIALAGSSVLTRREGTALGGASGKRRELDPLARVKTSRTVVSL